MTSYPNRPARIALVGDRSPLVQAHAKIPILIDVLSRTGDNRVEPYWLHSTTIEGPESVDGFDGVWVVPGSPYENAEGVIAAVEWARTGGIPYLGTCGGFQYMLIEFARHVCGIAAASHAESDPDAAESLIVPLSCSLLGEEAPVRIRPSTLAAELMGAGSSTERFFCRYGLSVEYAARLEAGGLVFSGQDDDGSVRVAELPSHPFFIGSLFQPELSSDPSWVHPLISGFVDAARRRAGLSLVEAGD
jgi:CTP synthase (UTP-ammonia lyase)